MGAPRPAAKSGRARKSDESPAPTPQSSLEVAVIAEAPEWPPESAGLVRRAAAAAMQAAGRGRLRGELAVLLADDAELTRLNRTFRNRNEPTDVLSFPGAPAAGGRPRHLGDIAISWQRCERDARALARSLDFHLAHLVIHGVLHCLGYDHETDEQAQEMEARERRALLMLGFGEPYPEDTPGDGAAGDEEAAR